LEGPLCSGGLIPDAPAMTSDRVGANPKSRFGVIRVHRERNYFCMRPSPFYAARNCLQGRVVSKISTTDMIEQTDLCVCLCQAIHADFNARKRFSLKRTHVLRPPSPFCSSADRRRAAHC